MFLFSIAQDYIYRDISLVFSCEIIIQHVFLIAREPSSGRGHAFHLDTPSRDRAGSRRLSKFKVGANCEDSFVSAVSAFSVMK